MDGNQDWYRQLAALVLLSASRAAVEYITNPGSRTEATSQLKGAFAEIDYDAIARALTRSINDLADTSKDRLSGTIDTLRERGVGAVDDAKSKAEQRLAPRRKGRKMRFLFGLIMGAVIAYFVLDEQRRDDLLDRLTGAGGPIQQTMPDYSPPPPSSTATGSSGSESSTGASSSTTSSESATE
ncbi:MAG TPA: hypothetical protein VKX16_04205 [Chloroflexota bacterium]|nr:hypothetical protein [Chloroflexota bacterium]